MAGKRNKNFGAVIFEMLSVRTDTLGKVQQRCTSGTRSVPFTCLVDLLFRYLRLFHFLLNSSWGSLSRLQIVDMRRITKEVILNSFCCVVNSALSSPKSGRLARTTQNNVDLLGGDRQNRQVNAIERTSVIETRHRPRPLAASK